MATINQNRSCIYRLPGYRGQVEKILFRKAIYEWRVSECQHSYIERILNFKKQKYFKVPSFWNSLACHQFHGEFYRANDIMEKESCKVFRIFPNCRTCFKKRIFSIVPFLVISNGISSCFQINTKRHDSGTKTVPAAWQDVDGWPLEQRQRLGRMQVPPLHPTWQIAKGKKW